MRIQRTNWKKMERQAPSYRVQRALARLSRERWIPGPEVVDLCRRLARCCTSASNVEKAAMAGECAVVGMIRGKPPAFHWEEDYGHFVAALYDKKFPPGITGELKILNLLLRRPR